MRYDDHFFMIVKKEKDIKSLKIYRSWITSTTIRHLIVFIWISLQKKTCSLFEFEYHILTQSIYARVDYDYLYFPIFSFDIILFRQLLLCWSFFFFFYLLFTFLNFFYFYSENIQFVFIWIFLPHFQMFL